MNAKTSQLSSAIHKALGFTLIETILVVGGLSAMAAGSLVFYQYSRAQADIRSEQEHVQALAANSERIKGVLGSYEGYTTTEAIDAGAVDPSMIQGAGLLSRWSAPVSVEPATVAGRANAGLKITYEAVPPRACAKFVSSAAAGMIGVEVGQVSVLDRGVLQTQAVIDRCAEGADVAFTYYGGATALSGNVLPPVSLAPPAPPSAPPPPAPPPAAPPEPPGLPPPATPGCSAAPSIPAAGTTPPGQTCSFVWSSAPYPACWTSTALCAPIVAPAPNCGPAPTVPSCPSGTFNNYQYWVAPHPTCWTLAGGCVAPPVSPPVCSAPPPVVAQETRPRNCPAGSFTPSGSSSYIQTRDETTTYSCPDPFSPTITSAITYSAWLPAVAPCVAAPSCVAPPATSLSITRSLPPEARNTCPAGWTGTTPESRTRTENGTRTTTWSCPAPTGPATSSANDAWHGTINYGTWIASGPNTCAPPTTPPPPPNTGVCPGRPLTIGCATFNTSTRMRLTPISIGEDNGAVFRTPGQYVRCTLGYADNIEADGFPSIGADRGRYRFVDRGACGMTDWESEYGVPEECSSYVRVYARNADGTNGQQCFGEAKITFNWDA